MRYQGKLVKWHDDKGYGFLKTSNDSKEVFLHISDSRSLAKRPEVKDLLSYELIRDGKGRFRAVNVAYAAQSLPVSAHRKPVRLNSLFVMYILMFLTFVLERTLSGFLPITFTLILLGSNLILFLYYYQDKTSAIKQGWRTPESTLHWLSLVGGWPGAYVAQRMFNHKHKKSSFVAIYKLTVLLNCIALMLYALPALQNLLLGYITAHIA